MIFRRRKTEKLAIVVTGFDFGEQIVNSIFIQSGTGKAVAETVFASLQSWDLDKIVMGKCYDTTRVNSGEKNGASVILERLMKKKLLDLPCRHHIYELVLMAAYNTCFKQASSSPENTLFKLFRDEWDNIDTSNYSGLPEGTDKFIYICLNKY